MCVCGSGWGGKVGRRNHLVRGALSFTLEFFLRDETKGKITSWPKGFLLWGICSFSFPQYAAVQLLQRLTPEFKYIPIFSFFPGVLNLAHLRGHSPEEVKPVPTHEIFQARLKLDSTAYRVAAGHKIRLALSSVYWPFVWPSPHVTCLSVHTGSKSKLLLPVRVSKEEVTKRDSQLGEFESSDACKRFTLPVEWRRKPQKARYVNYGALKGTTSRFNTCSLIKMLFFLPGHAVSSMKTKWSCHNVVKEPICTLPWQLLD